MKLLLLVIISLLSVPGLIMLVVGWRGRLVGDHPYCRRCGFDLFGSPKDSLTCPECGAQLLKTGTRIGQRKRWRGMIASGATMLIVATGLVGVTVWQSTSKAIFYAYVPTFYLIWVVDDADARTELNTRLSNNALTKPQGQTLADAVLAVQGNTAQTWDDSWGLLIESTWDQGILSDAQLKLYFTQAISNYELVSRPQVQIGRDPVVYIKPTANNRLGSNSTFVVKLWLKEVLIDSQIMPLTTFLKDNPSEQIISKTKGGGGSPHISLKNFPKQLGSTTVKLACTVNMTATSPNGVYLHHFDMPAIQLTTSIQVVKERTGQYVTGSQPLDQRARNAGILISNNDRGERFLVFAVIDQPEFIRPQGWLRIGGELLPLDWSSHSTFADRARGHRYSIYWNLKRIIPDRFKDIRQVDVIVRHNRRDVETEPTVKPVWLGEWEFRDVPLDGESIEYWRLGYKDSIPTLVPAIAREITIEQFERDPSVQRVND